MVATGALQGGGEGRGAVASGGFSVLGRSHDMSMWDKVGGGWKK